ncbi:MAG: hypothetical protein QM528_07100 [Phycisphaerales bacterium]|nr:hypothetical protein [Phycisphaerales bacterium]
MLLGQRLIKIGLVIFVIFLVASCEKTVEIGQPTTGSIQPLIASSSILSFEGSRYTDSLALVDFYKSTNGDNWYDNYKTNWLSNLPIDQWYGVYFYLPPNGGEVARVYALSLPNGHLTGNLPASFGRLNYLNSLDLSQNPGLGGALPDSFGSLDSLVFCSLYNDGFSGAIPESIGNLQNIQVLWLYGNQFTSIPNSIGNLSNLTELYLLDNKLTGNIPASIGDAVSLKYMLLENNQLTGTLPASIGNMKNLQVLDVSNNNLTGIIPNELTGAVNLTKQGNPGSDLSNNNFDTLGTAPSVLSWLRLRGIPYTPKN